MKPLLLIADDEQELCSVLHDLISPTGVDIIMFHDGQSALDAIEASQTGRPIDAVLSDINMPKLNGLKLLEEVRKRGFRTPFLFLTAFSDKEKAVHALRLGAVDFHEKPYDTDLLMESVRKALELGVLLRDLRDEVSKALDDRNLTAEERKKFEQAFTALVVMRKKRKIYHSKAG